MRGEQDILPWFLSLLCLGMAYTLFLIKSPRDNNYIHERKTICWNDTHKRNFCIKIKGNWAAYSLLKIKRPLEECLSPHPQLLIHTHSWLAFLPGLSNWRTKNLNQLGFGKLQKSKTWGMEAMSPGSMAGCRPGGQEEANSAQAYGYFSSENPDLAEDSYHKSKAYQFTGRCSHLFLLPRLLFLGAWDLSLSSKARGQSQSPEHSVALEFSICQLWNWPWSLFYFLCCQTE